MIINSTKTQIFNAAIDLFAKNGYDNVSMRQIASEVGIKAASIYNHYGSKEDILNDIFDYYEGNLKKYEPDLNWLLELVGRENPREILKRTIIIYPDDILPHMSKAMLIADKLSRTNERAGKIVYNMIHLAEIFDRPILEKLLRLGLIEPLDIDSFMSIHSNYCYAAAVRYYEDRENQKIETAEYNVCLDMIFRLVVPIALADN